MQLTLTILNLREKILVLTRFQTPFVFVHVCTCDNNLNIDNVLIVKNQSRASYYLNGLLFMYCLENY